MTTGPDSLQRGIGVFVYMAVALGEVALGTAEKIMGCFRPFEMNGTVH
jgi:hypothetical protein